MWVCSWAGRQAVRGGREDMAASVPYIQEARNHSLCIVQGLTTTKFPFLPGLLELSVASTPLPGGVLGKMVLEVFLSIHSAKATCLHVLLLTMSSPKSAHLRWVPGTSHAVLKLGPHHVGEVRRQPLPVPCGPVGHPGHCAVSSQLWGAGGGQSSEKCAGGIAACCGAGSELRGGPQKVLEGQPLSLALTPSG
jgi:hypothetical protein